MFRLNNSSEIFRNASDAIKFTFGLPGFNDSINQKVLEDESLKREYFEDICQIAKEKNENDKNFVSHINIYQNGHTPVSLLAYEGDHEAVLFLINKFNAKLSHAIYGAALGNNQNLMWHLIKHSYNKKSALDYAAYGAAQGRHDNLRMNLIKAGASSVSAVEGAACSKRGDVVNNFIIRNDYDIKGYMCAIRGYARGGHVDLINETISICSSRQFLRVDELFECVVIGAWHAGYLTEKNILRFISSIENESLRCLLAEVAKKSINNSLDVDLLLTEAKKRRKIMKEYALNFEQSKALTVKKAHIFALQGSQTVKNGSFSADIFRYLSSIFFGLPAKDTEIVIKAIQAKYISEKKIPVLVSFFKNPLQIKQEKEKETDLLNGRFAITTDRSTQLETRRKKILHIIEKITLKIEQKNSFFNKINIFAASNQFKIDALIDLRYQLLQKFQSRENIVNETFPQFIDSWKKNTQKYYYDGDKESVSYLHPDKNGVMRNTVEKSNADIIGINRNIFNADSKETDTKDFINKLVEEHVDFTFCISNKLEHTEQPKIVI